MSLLVKLKDRQTGQPVIADDDDNEFLNIINVLAGQDVGKSIRIVNSDSTFAAARFDQNVGTGNIAEFFKQGTSKAIFDTNGDLVISHVDSFINLIDGTDNFKILLDSSANKLSFNLDGISSEVLNINLDTAVVTFNTQPVLPNARTRWSANFFIADPSTHPADSFNLSQKVLIPGANFVATHVGFIYNTGSASGSFDVIIRKHPFGNQSTQTDLHTFTIDTESVGVGVEVDISDHTFTEKDFLYVILSNVSSPLHRDVTIYVRGYQNFVNG